MNFSKVSRDIFQKCFGINSTTSLTSNISRISFIEEVDFENSDFNPRFSRERGVEIIIADSDSLEFEVVKNPNMALLHNITST